MTLLRHLLDNGYDPSVYLDYYDDSVLCAADISDSEMHPEQFAAGFTAAAYSDQAEDNAKMEVMLIGWNAAGRDFKTELAFIRAYVKRQAVA